MKHSNLPNNFEPTVKLDLDSYDLYLLLESVKAQLHKNVESCDNSNISSLFLLLTKIKKLMETLDPPF